MATAQWEDFGHQTHLYDPVIGVNDPAAGVVAPKPPKSDGVAAPNGVMKGVCADSPKPLAPCCLASDRASWSAPSSISVSCSAIMLRACTSCFVSTMRSTMPVPTRASWPSITFSVTPLRTSISENTAACMKISTVSSKDARNIGPESPRLIPWRDTAMMYPGNVMQSAKHAMWR